MRGSRCGGGCRALGARRVRAGGRRLPRRRTAPTIGSPLPERAGFSLQNADCEQVGSCVLCAGEGHSEPTGIGRNRRPAACRLHIATTKKPNAWWFSGTHSRIPPRDSSGLRCRNERHSACTRQTEPAALILAHSASTTNPHIHTSSPCRVPLTLQFSDLKKFLQGVMYGLGEKVETLEG